MRKVYARKGAEAGSTEEFTLPRQEIALDISDDGIKLTNGWSVKLQGEPKVRQCICIIMY